MNVAPNNCFVEFSAPCLLSVPLVVCPVACAREAHSDGAQSVCSPVASSTEAFQLLQGDLTKISCPLLNYNLPSTSLSSSPSLHFEQKKQASPFVFLPTDVCVCVRVMCACTCEVVWAASGRKECVRWLAGHASEVGQQGDQGLRLLLSAPFHFSPSCPCFFTFSSFSCRNDFMPPSWLLSPLLLLLPFHLLGASFFFFLSSLSFDTSFHPSASGSLWRCDLY